MKNKISTLEKEFYIAPDIEVIGIELEQHMLADGSGGGTLDAPADDWF